MRILGYVVVEGNEQADPWRLSDRYIAHRERAENDADELARRYRALAGYEFVPCALVPIADLGEAQERREGTGR